MLTFIILSNLKVEKEGFIILQLEWDLLHLKLISKLKNKHLMMSSNYSKRNSK